MPRIVLSREDAGPLAHPRKLALLATFILAAVVGPTAAHAQNPIVVENQLTGNPASEWDVSGAGDSSIQGFATDISVDQGGTIDFKIDTPATSYRIDIYRLGWYGGLGARKVATVLPSATLQQAQPAGIADPTTGLLDCGNWAISASWSVPANATSGVYIAKLVRTDPEDGRASHIAFVVRDDDGGSALLFQTSETTWQAYNTYGGNSLYAGSATTPPVARAHKVSFNRPFATRGGPLEDWVFNAEYPMIRWLERNGYDVSYFTDTDSDRRGAEILEHQVFLSVGHDEYWSAGQRANVEAARNAGVHLAFFSGNEVYWKTRWENSVDVSGTPYRTLVCYKEGTLGEIACGGKCDPLPGVWTGLWRDGCPPTYAPNDACLPENALSGNISWDGSTGAIQVPDTYKNLRFWRNTAVASLGAGQTATLGSSTLGYEWDWQQYEASYPARRILLSTTDFNGKTHHLSLYRHDSGALVFAAGTVQWSWGLDSNHDRGSDPPNSTIQQATVNVLADMGAEPGSLQADLVSATPSSDAQTPASVIGFPLAGGSVPSGNSVNIQGTASDVGGGVVAGVEVSVDGGATWHAATGTTPWSYAWTPVTQGPVTIKSRAFDDTGNLEVPTGPANVIGVTVTEPAPPVCPCTVFQPTDAPTGPTYNDGQSINAGMKFRTSVDGFVTGARFYKGAANTGTHTGVLWSSTGTPLAQAVFTGESASGWQEVTFTSPVPVTAGTTYVVAYHSSGGGYAANDTYFATAVVNGPLRALAWGEDGPNGVYEYGATPTFPASNYLTSNYWVDVVFNTAVGPDETPPTVTALSPTNGAPAVAVGASVSATFNEAIDPATVSGSTFELRDPTSALVPATVSYGVATRTATLAPSALLATSTAYTATIKGGATDPRIKDLAGNALASTQTWSFTTAAPPPPPPNEGPGGPILVVASAANPFTRYYAEILRAEGFNEFTVTDVSNLTREVLDTHDLVIVGDMSLSSAQVSLLGDWVTAGGRLIAMRPDKQLASLLGLTDAAATLGDQYLLVDTSGSPGRGITGETMQYHGTADLYALNGATAVATLYSNATTATPNPAVTLRSVGSSGGRAAAFTFDLARSVVYTRQGNPAWAGQERDLDAVNVIRADDMFFGPPTTPPSAPEWVDRDKLHIPQADEQQRLLANLILQMNMDRKPLPRLWYLPKGLKAAIMLRGDDHGAGNTIPRFDQYIAQSPGGCSLDDWECVRTTSFLFTSAPITDAQVQQYTNLGFEIGLHLDSNIPSSCSNYFTDSQIEAFYAPQLAAFNAKFPSLGPTPITNMHCGTWSMWVGLAQAELRHGNRLDGDYYYWVGWPPNWLETRPGVFTGSAIPMRFGDLDGSIVDVYQVPTQMTDESGQSYPLTVDSLLSRALDARGYYGIYHANMHTDFATEASSDIIVSEARARGVPIISCRQVLTWLDGRNNSSFQALAWDGSVLSFDVAAAAGSRNMEAMLPTMVASAALNQVRRDNAPLPLRVETIKGVQYAFFPATSGHYAATYEVDTTPPVISAVTATPSLDGSATITWTTDEAADSRVDYGTDSGTLSQNAVSATLATSHGITLSGLTGNTTYYFRVTSVDGFLNTATSPATPAPPASFATPTPPCLVDRTSADFALGTSGAGIAIAATGDGEVILSPALLQDFNGASLPADWMWLDWNSGGPGSMTLGTGTIVLDGARANPTSLTGYGPGTTVEFVATFQAATFQGGGFGAGDNSAGGLFSIYPIALIGTGDGTTVKARSGTSGGDEIKTELSPSLIGAPHRYRIDWLADHVEFYVDGALVASHASAIGGTMRPGVSDYFAGGPTYTVDWMRIGPYAASGTFTSRVFDAGSTATWGNAFWAADVPGGSSLTLSVRTGGTPAPDGTWTSFNLMASSGSPIGASSRFIQYQAALTSATGLVTPTLADFTATCSVIPDAIPPVISGVGAATAGNGTSEDISWTTDELADSRVDYGTSPGALTLSASAASPVTSHALTLTGLAINTAYYYRVRSEDGSHNVAFSPALADPPLHFNTPVSAVGECFADRTSADFGQGTTGGTSYVSETTDGEVILAPAVGAEFSGSSLPAGWVPQQWQPPSGAVSVSGGQVTLNGYAITPSGYYGPYGTFEAVATFTGETFQHVGLENFAASGSPYAIFSTFNTTNQVWARVPGNDTPIAGSGSWIGSPHLYRLVWQPGSFEFWVDGVLKATLSMSISGPMRPFLSDFSAGAANLSVDWARLSPYAATGSYLSRVYDAGGVSDWMSANWTADTPSGTSLAMNVRTGDTPVPDGSWSAFIPIPAPGNGVGRSSQYVQYRADLGTSVSGATPVLKDFALECRIGPDMTPPVITNVEATPNPNGVAATISWTTNEIADSRVDYGTSPGALTLTVTDAALLLSHGLALTGLSPGVTYSYRVTSTDSGHNPTTEPSPPAAPLTFTTPEAVCAQDRTDADFAAGTASGTYLSVTSDGEVTLAPTLGAEFAGTSLPADWMELSWNNPGVGTVAVGGGVVTVDGARVNPLSLAGYGPSVVLEYVARFQPENFQGVGFGGGDNSITGLFNDFPFALFGTGNGIEVKARSGPAGGPVTETALSGLTGAFHRYRVEWDAGEVRFYVDGVLRATHPSVGSGPMRPAISDYVQGGATTTVDWLRLAPYAASGSYNSRVFDAGDASTWGVATWSADAPLGTTLVISVRGGNIATPDGSWSAFQPVASSGANVAVCSRYLQYRADLGTTDAALTPALRDIAITCRPGGTAVAVTALVCTPAASGNDASGRTQLQLAWAGGGGGGGVKVYSKGYGDYPTYRDGVGAIPAAPATPAEAQAEGWTLTTVTASQQLDQPPTRDFWYYVAFDTDACGNASPVSNLTTGMLDYVLGDVSDGLTNCAGDNLVSAADVSLLGFYYGGLTSQPLVPDCLDVGPTLDGSSTGRPVPDGVAEFEDLVILALNYHTPPGPGLLVARTRALASPAAAANALAVVEPQLPAVGEMFAVTVHAAGAGDVRAVSLALGYDRSVVEMIHAEAGELLSRQDSPAVVMSPGPGRVDVALLGKGAGLSGEGDLIRVEFRRISAGDPGIVLARSDARDGANRRVSMNGTPRPQAPALPAVTLLAPGRPNPFRETVTIAFALARRGSVDLAVYGVDGRRVRTLVRDVREPGEYEETWDGRDERGQGTTSGVYYVRLATDQGRFVRKVMYLR